MNLSKRRRADVTVRQSQVRVIEKIKHLSSELKFLTFADADALERREVPIGVARPLYRVASFISELLYGRVWIRSNTREGIGVEPLLRRLRSGVGIADNVGAIAGKTRNLWRASLQRYVGRFKHCERRAALQRHDSIKLPVAQDVLIPGVRLSPERKAPLVAQDKAVPRIE